MQNTSFSQWCNWLETYRHLPYVERYQLTNPHLLNERGLLKSWEPVWQTAGGSAFVLESGKNGRYTVVGMRPAAVMSGATTNRGNTDHRPSAEEAPLQRLKKWMAPFRSPVLQECPHFTGGCVGYLSYDIGRSLERLSQQADNDLRLPDYYFARYDEIFVIDHETSELICIAYTTIAEETPADSDALQEIYQQARARTNHMYSQWQEWALASQSIGDARKHIFRSLHNSSAGHEIEDLPEGVRSFSRPQFVEAVTAVQRYIAAGDVFQVNLSVRESKRLQTTGADIYEWLRLLNPSPYMGFLKFPEFELVCGSPELLVKLENGRLTTRPIAGTRPRGNDELHDGELAAELILNEKERAEHIMLVDLERNDIGRVSTPGSVHVSELMAIEKYSHVMHIVSQVEGKLRPELDAFDAIAAVFPGGTITGAPKIRTMEIIEELEPVRRGPYTGSLGWIDCNGNMELNIIIRTLIARDGWAHVQAGAGIVIDSVPDKEYTESLNKAKALWKAVQFSERSDIGVTER